MAQKVSIPKGTRDFSPIEMKRRYYIFNTIKEVYHLYGFQPIETPALENLSTLMGKYGEEGDKLLFKVLNSGEYGKKVDDELWNSRNYSKLTTKISEKGLRYDLTVPFARYVVQHQNEIAFPFKRYQIQPVWRADRPQKGRYREFYQCDADVVGSNSLIYEAEIVMMIDEVFNRLGINTTIKINSRKLLTGIAELIGKPELITNITVAIDKLDKIGIDNVCSELIEVGLTQDELNKIIPIIELNGDNENKLSKIETLFNGSKSAVEGKNEIETVLNLIKDYPLKNKLEFDLSLARGLSYYTGCIFEVKANDAEMGSICGGGRYDNLTGIFGLKDVSGVGISFGADRIYDVLNQLNKFPNDSLGVPKALFINFGENELPYIHNTAIKLRNNNIPLEIYPENAKMKKQMSYANKKGFPYVILAGENEIKNNTYTVKDMVSGEQETININELLNKLK